MPPEVGKVGTNSPTFVQPVSERSDGIKSFYQKQSSSASPAKAKKADGGATGEGAGADVKEEAKPASSSAARGVQREMGQLKDEKAGVRGEDTEKDSKADEEEGRAKKRRRRRSSSSPILIDEAGSSARKAEPGTVITDEDGKVDPEPGLGVDSNAPIPETERAKDGDRDGHEDRQGEDGGSAKKKRGGHEIKVTRKPEEGKTDVSHDCRSHDTERLILELRSARSLTVGYGGKRSGTSG